MATNYTTKTAALKATIADIRKVTAKSVDATDVTADSIQADDLTIKDGDKYSSVADLISTKSGVTVGYGTDLVGPGDNDSDGILSGGTKMGGLNFRGSYVMLVPKADGTADLWFGPNNNPDTFNKMGDVNGSSKTVYASSTDPVTYDITGITAGGTYSIVDSTGNDESIKFNDGDEMTVTEPTSLEVTITTGAGNTYTAKTSIAADGTVTPDSTGTGITINITDVKVNNDQDDADAGFTPGFIRCKASVTLDNATICPNGGTYSGTVKFAGQTKNISKIFVYKPYALTATDKPAVSASYSKSDDRHVSGVRYDNGGTITVNVTNIQSTQKTITTNSNRLTLSEGGNGMVADLGVVTLDKLTLTSGDATKDNAIYSYSTTTAVTSGTPSQLNCTISATPHGQGSTAVNAAKATATVSSGTAWVWTGATEDTSLVTNFYTEKTATWGRQFKTLAQVKENTGSDTYDETALLSSDAYSTQLLVQGGYLKYPNSDTTGTYSGLTGTRYFVRPIQFSGSGNQITTINVSVSGMGNSYNTSSMRIYLAKAGTPDVHLLNAFKGATSTYGNTAALSSAPEDGAWECEMNSAVFPVFGGTTYYLVVEMDQGAAAIGKITLA